MFTRLRHLVFALSVLPRLLPSRQQRALLGEMRAFSRSLPQTLQRPLPQAMLAVTPTLADGEFAESRVRRLADLTALLERRSPLGFCLRRSLIRYHFLRRAGVPLRVHFGARFREDTGSRRIGGHAWVTLDGQPYYEADEHWRHFEIMYSWPEQE